MTSTVEAVEEALNLSEELPTDTEVLFPECKFECKLLDGTEIVLYITPWGLGRFVQAQTELGSILIEFSALFQGFDLDQLDETVSTEMLTNMLNLIMPHIQSLLLVTLGASSTFKEFVIVPTNLRRFVDELPLETAVRIALVVLRQNWRHIKNVLGLAEVKALAKAISAGQSSS